MVTKILFYGMMSDLYGVDGGFGCLKLGGFMVRRLYALLCVLLGFVLFSCASNKEQVVDPDFLGDYDPMQLEDVMGWVTLFGNEKPKEIELFFVPRTNRVEMYFRDLQNRICIVLTPEHRQMMIDAAIQFMEESESGNMPDRKANSKNYYAQSVCSVGWGVTGIARVTEKSRLQFNYEYFKDGRPYFLMKALPAPDKEESDVFSPTIEVYFSPAQLEALYEVLNQEALQAAVDELDAKAYAY